MDKLIKLHGCGTLNQTQVNFIRDIFNKLENIEQWARKPDEMDL